MPKTTPWSAQISDYLTSRSVAALSTTGADATTRLPAGPHWGIIEGFEALGGGSFDREGRASELMDQAVASGASISRVQIDWAELETAPGVYDQWALDDLVAQLTNRGQAGFVTLSTLDSEGYTLPSYMAKSLTELHPGYSLGSESVQTAFAGLLDWLVPQLTAAGVWGLSLGNEVVIPVEDGLVSQSEAADFFENGMAHAKSLDPGLAVTVTLTSSAAVTAPELTQRIVEASSIFSVNFYGGNTNPSDPDSWEAGLAELKAMASGLPIFFQELGMPVGYEAAGLTGDGEFSSSLAVQEAFFAFMGQAIALDDQLLGATVFQLFDWSPELLEEYLSGTTTGESPSHFSQFIEALATMGLAAWSDGATRPAWNTWLDAMETASSIRTLLDMPVADGTAQNDEIFVSGDGHRVFAHAGDDTVIAGAGNDAVLLGSGNDAAMLGDGDDIALGEDGQDEIIAGNGDDWAQGGDGADTLQGEAGADTLLGGDGDDLAIGDDGDDILEGEAGDDALLGGAGADLLMGGTGSDMLWGDAGSDTLLGGDGNDIAIGDAGNDRLDGQAGDDVLYGGADHDALSGGQGDDVLLGDSGNDTLDGGAGEDALIGGSGADTFVFTRGGGLDLIMDFDIDADRLELHQDLIPDGTPLADTLEQIAYFDGENLTLDFGNEDFLILTGVTLTELLSADLTLI